MTNVVGGPWDKLVCQREKQSNNCWLLASVRCATLVQGIVRPKCGRMVSFRSETAHGVLPVFTGRRCALLVWMTFTGREEEEARADFDRLLRDIDGRVRKNSESDDRWDLLWNMRRD
ncbi:hypothetical protein MTO96_029269 [Rhipicephalus appendiculatus]